MVMVQPERMESLEITTVYQPDDAGQMAVAAAADGKTLRWFKWELPSGAAVYAAGYVTGYGPTADSSNDYVASTFTIKPVYDANGVGPVIVAAP